MDICHICLKDLIDKINKVDRLTLCDDCLKNVEKYMKRYKKKGKEVVKA